ncbi:hypothetical protein VKT23_013686 [Stygiomarasmius scandens]|uniref:Transmembrane protein n=1 Tax=Marasmiellus scandens TaxID=2682957 RepID=A0ABR1J2I2_9AGAR
MTHHDDDDDSLASPTSPFSPANTITQETATRTRLHSSPERHRSDSGAGGGHFLNCVPEDGAVEFERDVPEAVQDEEDEWDVDKELEEQGLYRGSYRTLVLLYAFAPLTFVLGFILFVFLPLLMSPSDTQHPYPYSGTLPFPIPELLVSLSLYSLSHVLRSPFYTLSQTLLSWIYSLLSSTWQSLHPNLANSFIITLSTLIHTLVTTVLRLAAFPILLVSDSNSLFTSHGVDHQPFYTSFVRVWWIALGWALIEAVVGIIQGYQSIALYKDVLVNVDEDGRPVGRDFEEGTREGRTSDGNGKGKGKLAKVYGTFGKQPQPSQETQTQMGPLAQGQDQSSSSPRPPSLSREISSNSQRLLQDQNLENVHERFSSAEENEPLLGSISSISRFGFGTGRRSDIELPYLANLSSLSIEHGDNCENLEQSLELQVNQDLDELMLLRARDELERLCGVPFIKIPVFVSCLQRINSLLLSVGVTVLLGAAYLSTSTSSDSSESAANASQLFFSSFSSPHSSIPIFSLPSSPAPHKYLMLARTTSSTLSPSNLPSPAAVLAPTIVLLVIISLLHTQLLLPRLGVHTVVYIGALLSLGAFFAALGVWGVLE